jgi:Rrf2 family protein
MKLSTRGRYGIRMLIDLSLQPQGKVTTLSSIAARQEISASYLEQVAKDLKRAGYIHSVKGSQGGYILAKEPQDIIIGDLLRLLEGDMRLTDIYYNDESILQTCIRESVYDIINNKISNLIDFMTLNDLLT